MSEEFDTAYNQVMSKDKKDKSEFDTAYEQVMGKPKADTGSGLIGDVITGVGEGVLRTPSTIAGALDIIPGLIGYDAPVDKALTSIGEATGFQPEKLADETKYSEKLELQKQNLDKVWDDPEKSGLDVAKEYVTNPALIADIASKSAAPMGLAGVAGKLAAKAGVAGAAYLGEGAVMAGDTMSQLDDSVSPQQKALTSLVIGGLGAGIGKIGGKVSEKAGVLDPEKLLSQGYTKEQIQQIQNKTLQRIGTGAGIETGEELAQTTAETGLQNIAEGKDFGEGMARSQIEGALVGGAMGAGANIAKPKGALSRAVLPHLAKDEIIKFKDGSVARASEVERQVFNETGNREQARKIAKQISSKKPVERKIPESNLPDYNEVSTKIEQNKVDKNIVEATVENKKRESDKVKEEESNIKREQVYNMVNTDLEKGGGIVVDKDGKRSQSVNADWFKEGKFTVKSVDGSKDVTPTYEEVVVASQLNRDSKPLTKRQSNIVKGLESEIESQETESKLTTKREQEATDNLLKESTNQLLKDSKGTNIEKYLKKSIEKGEIKTEEDLVEWRDDLNDVKSKIKETNDTTGMEANAERNGSIDSVSGKTDGRTEQATPENSDSGKTDSNRSKREEKLSDKNKAGESMPVNENGQTKTSKQDNIDGDRKTSLRSGTDNILIREKSNEVESQIQNEQSVKTETKKKDEKSKTQTTNVDPILSTSKSKYINEQLKSQKIKKTSPGYKDVKKKAEIKYEDSLLKAEASLSFGDFRKRALDSNPKESENVSRQSYDALREEFGIKNEPKKKSEQVQIPNSDKKTVTPESKKQIEPTKENKDIKRSLDTIKGIDSGEVIGSTRALFVASVAGKIKTLHKNGKTKEIDDILNQIKTAQKELKKPLISYANKIWELGSGEVKFSKQEQQTTKTTESDIKGWLTKKQKNMVNAGKLNIVESWKDLPAELRERGEALSSGGVNNLHSVEGLYDPKTDSTYLIQNMLDENNIHQVLNHELYHRALVTDKKLKQNRAKLDARLQQRYNLASKGKGSQVEKDAYARVMDADTKQSDQLEEFQAYLVSAYNAKPESFTGQIKKWVQDLIASIKAVLIRQGVLPKNITPADLNALAQYGTKVDNITGKVDKDNGNLLASLKPAGRVLSSQFKRWFGKSKMRSGGKPIKFYHGTNADFTIFNTDKIGKSKGQGTVTHSTAELGHFFTADKGTADSYGTNTHEVYLAIQNPYVVSSDILDKNMGDDTASFVKRIKAKGYDGIYVKDAKYAIAFESNQIKLTSNERPSFADDIRYSKSAKKPSRFNVSSEQKETMVKAKVNVKKFMQRYFTPKGLMTDKVFDIKLKSDFMKNVGEKEVQFLSYKLRKDVLKAYNVPHYADLPSKVTQEINKELNGEKSNLPKEVRETVVTMRAMMDSLSGELQQSIMDNIELRKETMNEKQISSYDLWVESNGERGNAPEDLINASVMLRTIENNKGNYVHRSYQAFDDTDWMDKALNNTDLISRSETFISEQNPELTPSQVSAEVKGILQTAKDKGDMSAVISRGRKQGSKDMSIMKKRKDIPLIIRELLGEHKDPLVNFTKSTTKMQWFVANHYFLTNVRKDGVGVFLLKKRDTVNGVDYIQPVASKSNKSLSPLSGLFTSVDFNNALEDVVPNNNSSDLVNQYIKWNSAVKYGKTILSPTTQFRNFMSAGMFSIMSGHFNWSHGTQALKVMRSDIFTQEAKYNDYIKDLIGKGVLHDNPFAGELRDALNDFYEQQDFSSGTKKGVKAGLKRALEFAQKSYQAGDDFWKIIGYENELQQQLNNGLSQKEAEIKAAYRIRNGYPTYSMVPKGMRWLRRFPLMGTFVSFPYEIVRTTINNVGFIREDMKNDPSSVAKRVIGMSVASSTAYAASQLSMVMMGLSGEDDEAIKLMGPEWSRNSQLFYTGYDENGLPQFLDLSSLDPYTYLKKPLTAVLSGNNDGIDDKLKDAVKEMLDPFLGMDIAAGKIFEVVSNKKESGGIVYNEQDRDDVKMGKVLNHLRKGLQPGVMSNVERMAKAVMGSKSRSGKEYKVSDEIAAIIGFRMSTANMNQSLIYKGYSFIDDKKNAQRILSSTAGTRMKIPNSDLETAFNDSMYARDNAYKKMIKLAKSMINFGSTRQDVIKALRGSGVTMKDAYSIVRGVIPDWRMSSQFIKSAVDRAMVSSVGDSERSKIRRDMIERKRFIKRLEMKQ